MSVSSLSGVFGLKRQAKVGQKAAGPYNADGANAVQTITINGTPNAGTYTLSFNGKTTAGIAYNADKTAIESALAALSTIGAGNVEVDGNGPFTATFKGELAGRPVPLMTANSSGLTGGSVSVSMTTDGGTWYWLPALNVSFQPNQIVQSIPPEVGGSLWARGSYKGGVYGGGNVTLVPRGGLGLAELLFAFCGEPIVETDDDEAFDAGAANKLIGDGTNGLPVGAFKYRFTPATADTELPWYTFIRNVGGKFIEEFQDGHLGSFAFDLSATSILQIDASFVSKSCATLAKGSGPTSPGAQLAGNGLPFQMVDVVVKLDTNDGGDPGEPAENVDYNPTRLNIGFMNELTENEFVVGSFFLQDITNLARSAQVTYSLYLRDAEIYNRVYNHGNAAADGSTGSAWDSEIWKGALNLTMTAGEIGALGVDYTIEVDIPELDYLAAPISLQGNSLVEYQLSANVVLSRDTSIQPFTIYYTTDEDIH